MPNVRAANKVKIGAWVDRVDAAKLRRLAEVQGLHLSTLIEREMQRVLPRASSELGHKEAGETLVRAAGGSAAIPTALK